MNPNTHLSLKGFASVTPENHVKMGSKFSCMFFSSSQRAQDHAASMGRKVFPAEFHIMAHAGEVPSGDQKVITMADLKAAMEAVVGTALDPDEVKTMEELWQKL